MALVIQHEKGKRCIIWLSVASLDLPYFPHYIIIIIIGIQPLGRSGQRPELSQATGMSLVRCILGKFLGVVCHCFPPLYHKGQKIAKKSLEHKI